MRLLTGETALGLAALSGVVDGCKDTSWIEGVESTSFTSADAMASEAIRGEESVKSPA